MRVRTPANIRRYALITLAALTICHLVFYLMNRSFILLHYASPDLKSFYWAAQASFIHSTSPYDVTYLQHLADGHVFPYLYPPSSLLLLSPLSSLSFSQAHLSLLLINHLMLPVIAVALTLALKKWVPGKLNQAIMCCMILNLLLLYAPAFGTIALGQVNLIVLLFLTLFILALQANSHPALCALLLAIPILLKTYPALLLILLLTQKRYRILCTTILILMLLMLLSAYVLPAGLWQIWLSEIVPRGHYGGIPEGLNAANVPWNQNINALMNRNVTFLSRNGFSYQWLSHFFNGLGYFISVGILATSVYYFRCANTQQYRNSVSNSLLEYGAILLVMVMIAPLTWDHHFVFVLPALLACIAHSSLDWRANKIKLLSLIIITVLMSLKFKFSAPIFNHGWTYLLASSKLFMVAWLWVICLRITKQASAPSNVRLPVMASPSTIEPIAAAAS
ncbi:MAG: hypothetical protein COB04_09480 [Gammaproteobacteria bacterium]|nr:MAG: hypothetical protein COB04_09480 [Gammaproteobacteria bacterium]